MVLKAALRDRNESILAACIGRFLAAADDDDVEQAFDELAGACGESPHGESIRHALAADVVAATLDTVCESWCDDLDPGVRTTELWSVVGLRCLKLIINADMLIGEMADVPEELRAAMREAVARQCRVFLYG